MKKPRRGRPVLDAKHRRQMFTLRITPDERAAIELAAEEAGVSVSDWARAALRAQTERAR